MAVAFAQLIRKKKLVVILQGGFANLKCEEGDWLLQVPFFTVCGRILELLRRDERAMVQYESLILIGCTYVAEGKNRRF